MVLGAFNPSVSCYQAKTTIRRQRAAQCQNVQGGVGVLRKSAFCPRLLSSLGCASARKLLHFLALIHKKCNYLVSYAGRHPQNINMIIEKICFNLLLIFHIIFFRFPDFIERGRRETS
jgi:hypothetical protein